MSDIYKGYELAEAVDNGLFSLEQRVNGAGYFNCTIGYILKDVGNNFLFKDFEIIEEQQEIDIQDINLDFARLGQFSIKNAKGQEEILEVLFVEIQEKMKELARKINYLDKNIKEK